MRSTTVYYLFSFLFNLGFGVTCTLYVPWLNSIGMSFSEISLINALFWVCVILFELPTGMLADGRGRGFSVTAGAICIAIGGFYYSTVNSFAEVLVAETIIALGSAFISGALSAWIADAKDRTEPLRHVHANATVFKGVAFVLGPFIAVPLTLASFPSAFWLIKGVVGLCAGAVAWRLMLKNEPERTMTEFEALRHAWTHLKQSSALRFSVFAQASTGLFGAFNLYWALLMLTKVSVSTMPWIWALMYGSLAGTGWLIRSRHGAGLNGTTGIVLSLALGGMPMMLFGLSSSTFAWLALIVLHEIGGGAFAPFAEAFVAERVDSGYRATYGSLQSFIGSLGAVFTLIATSLYMSVYDSNPETILRWWLLTGGAITAISFLLWHFRPRVE